MTSRAAARRALLGALLAAALSLPSGCEAIMYGEQAIVAVALKGQPDASAPVTGTLGIKHRVVAIVPPKGVKVTRDEGPGTAVTAGELPPIEFSASDAVSLLSSFKFNKTPGATGSPFDDTMSIRTALITGQAVLALRTQEQVKGAALAITPPSEKAIRLATANLILTGLEDMAARGDRRAADYVARLNAMTALVPATYPVAIYEASGTTGVTLARVRDAGDAVAGLTGARPFGAFVAYWAELDGSRAAIARALAGAAIIVEDGSGATSTLDAAAVTALTKELAATEEALAALERAIGRHPALATAQQYFLSAVER
jgi:hypothetical protein